MSLTPSLPAREHRALITIQYEFVVSVEVYDFRRSSFLHTIA